MCTVFEVGTKVGETSENPFFKNFFSFGEKGL